MLFVVDADVRIYQVNSAASAFVGRAEDAMLSQRGGEALRCVHAGEKLDSCGSAEACAECMIRTSVKRALQGARVQRETTEMSLVAGSGTRSVHFQITASRLSFEGAPYVLLVIEDITELKNAEEKMKKLNELLESQASTDPLTGISNRLRFNEALDAEIKRSQRYGMRLSLIMFDVDRFKAINDTYGHHTGDDALREVAELVENNIRGYDLFARWGGEEFMIMVTNSEKSHAVGLAEKLRALIEGRRFPVIGNITCSFGVTELIPGESLDRFMQRVDNALYRAKQMGRNRVEKA